MRCPAREGSRTDVCLDSRGRLALRGPLIDLFSRRVVGCAMSATMTAQLVTDALVMAIWRRGNDALLHHSDRPSQHTSDKFQQLMARPGRDLLDAAGWKSWDCGRDQSLPAMFNGLV